MVTFVVMVVIAGVLAVAYLIIVMVKEDRRHRRALAEIERRGQERREMIRQQGIEKRWGGGR